MKNRCNALVIGGGPAGLAAGISLKQNGIEDILILERENFLGGVLLQCIHNGFGLHQFKEELTGPEYAVKYIEMVHSMGIASKTETAVLKIRKKGDAFEIIALSKQEGLLRISAKAVILAMGCRERARGNISIPGSRPAGVMTAGLAQRMVNMEGYLPGKNVVILGSGDIGLIMARRMTWEGAHVLGVVEIQPYPGGLERNIVQCLKDFSIPLYLSHAVTDIRGNKRIKEVEVTPMNGNNTFDKSRSFTIPCDTLLLSVGLIPENELSSKAGVELHQVTKGAVVDNNLMTSVPGIFACGNVLHVHDIVDYVSLEGELCGKNAADFIKHPRSSGSTEKNIPFKTGTFVRYILPQHGTPGCETTLSLRPMTPIEKGVLTVWVTSAMGEKQILVTKKYPKLHPSEMIRLKKVSVPADAVQLEVGIAQEVTV